VKRNAIAFVDLIVLVVFVVIGLHSHGHQETVRSIADVWAPFAVGSLVADTLVARRYQPATWIYGLCAAWVTVACAMVIRSANGQGTGVAFSIVATLFVSLFFVGWRVAWSRLRR